MACCAKGGKKGGKGKDKNPLTNNGEGPARGTGHTLPRTRITAEKFTGVCTAWKGKYGWIKADEPIEHEKAAKRDGSLFVGMDDTPGGQGLEVGAPVEFHICEDDDGLGAEEVVQTGAGNPAKGKNPKGKGKDASKGGWQSSPGAAKGAAAGKGWTGGKATTGWAAALAGAGKGAWGGGAVKGVKGPWQPTPPTKGPGAKGGAGAVTAFNSPAAKGAAGKGKASGGKTGGAKAMPKNRLSAEKFTGTVKLWKGKFGWITPSEPIEHEKAKLRNGDLYVSSTDLEGATKELTVGSTVEFHIYEDSSGLGADEVVQY